MRLPRKLKKERKKQATVVLKHIMFKNLQKQVLIKMMKEDEKTGLYGV